MPVVGKNTAYLTGHDELHSMSKHLNVPNIRFWMGFGEHYINVFTVLKSLGLLSEKTVRPAEGLDVVPLKVVKAVLRSEERRVGKEGDSTFRYRRSPYHKKKKLQEYKSISIKY